MNARIYGLIDPRNQQIRYVGRTIQTLLYRLNEHISTSKRNKDKCSKGVWIRELLSLGLKPEIFEIEEVELNNAQAAEHEWVFYFRYIGADLLNDASPLVGGTRSHIIDWTAELDARLGKEPDGQLAVELGIDRKSVEYRRLKLGIVRYPQQNYVVPPMGGWNRTELPEDIIQQLGKVADSQLAQKLGVGKGVIRHARIKLGIPSWTGENNHPTRFKQDQPHPRWDTAGKRVILPEPVIARLGKESDSSLARELGIPLSNVIRVRKEHGIPAIPRGTWRKKG